MSRQRERIDRRRAKEEGEEDDGRRQESTIQDWIKHKLASKQHYSQFISYSRSQGQRQQYTVVPSTVCRNVENVAGKAQVAVELEGAEIVTARR